MKKELAAKLRGEKSPEKAPWGKNSDVCAWRV